MADVYLTPEYSKIYFEIRKCALAYIPNTNEQR
jgi:hypothetical protein